MAANAGETKVKLWEGICYPENMLDDWQEEIDDILQVPFAYAIHDIDHDQKSIMDIDGVWCVFHAMVPPTKKFKRELGWR